MLEVWAGMCDTSLKYAISQPFLTSLKYAISQPFFCRSQELCERRVAVLGFSSLIVLMVSVDITLNLNSGKLNFFNVALRPRSP